MLYDSTSSALSFWGKRMTMAVEKMIPYQLAVLEDCVPGVEPSHAIENFRIAAGLSSGTYYGMVFQDSDVGKWIEAASYSLMLKPDHDLDVKLDEIISIITAAQQPDGYLNTYYTVKEPGKRWTNLAECHELYCAGHLIEGAAAHFIATGKRTFLDVMCRMADHIASVFGDKPGQLRGYPGHPEIELALMRLYSVTGEKRYADLATFFINERGTKPEYFLEESKRPNDKMQFVDFMRSHAEYAQWHAPVREQHDAIGHAVRALYLYAGMTDVAAYSGDSILLAACERLWESVANRQRYITGAYGPQQEGEAFSIDYELPNDTNYGETCASVAMVFFSQRMLRLKGDRKYADVIENALFNTILAGTQLDGSRFFYCNPLEAVRGVSGRLPEYRPLLIDRPGWFACACCPPNVARLLTSLPSYAYEESPDTITVHQYLTGSCRMETAGGVTITHESAYPWDGKLTFIVAPEHPGASFTLRLRIPGWCRSYSAALDGTAVHGETDSHGYLEIQHIWGEKSEVCLTLSISAERRYANPRVREDACCVAFVRGPVVYCAESVDNGDDLHNLRVPRSADILVNPLDPELLQGVCTLSIQGKRVLITGDDLYTLNPPAEEDVWITLIPYYAWSNRGTTDMRVWLPETI